MPGHARACSRLWHSPTSPCPNISASSEPVFQRHFSDIMNGLYVNKLSWQQSPKAMYIVQSHHLSTYTLVIAAIIIIVSNVVVYSLLGTNCTDEFFLWVVRWTSHSIAVSFNMVEQGTIGTGSTPWYWVWVLVNTHIHGTVTPRSWCWHEVARVLQRPCQWTLSFSWDHCDCHPRWSIAVICQCHLHDLQHVLDQPVCSMLVTSIS